MDEPPPPDRPPPNEERDELEEELRPEKEERLEDEELGGEIFGVSRSLTLEYLHFGFLHFLSTRIRPPLLVVAAFKVVVVVFSVLRLH